MYSDLYVIVQTFDGSVNFMSFHDGKIVHQFLETDENRTAIDYDILVVKDSVFYARKNTVNVLKRKFEKDEEES